MTKLRAAKIILFVGLSLPTLQFCVDAYGAWGDGTNAQHILELTGAWSMWLLVAVLAVRPSQQIFNFPLLLRFRRMIGVFAAYYAAVHTLAYIADSDFDWGFVWAEIIGRPFLTIGTLGALFLVPLVATSTDGMLKRLGGRRWRRLQRLVFAAVIAAAIHYLLSTRLSPSVSLIQSGLLGWLLHYRLIVYRRRARGQALALGTGVLVWLGVAWSVSTGLMELAYFKVNTAIQMSAILASYLSPGGGLRPAIWVAVAATVVVVANRAHKYGARLKGDKQLAN